MLRTHDKGRRACSARRRDLIRIEFESFLLRHALAHAWVQSNFGSFVLLIGALVSGAWYYAKTKEIGDDERKVAFCGLIGAANVLAVIALSAEALGYFDRAQLLASGELVSSST